MNYECIKEGSVSVTTKLNALEKHGFQKHI